MSAVVRRTRLLKVVVIEREVLQIRARISDLFSHL